MNERIYNRGYQYGTDLQKMIDLLVDSRPREWICDYPSPNDLREELGSPSTQKNTGLWFNHTNDHIAFAFVDQNVNLRFEIDSDVQNDDVESQIALFGDRCVRRMTNNQSNQSLDTICRSDDHRREAFLRRNGFQQTADETITFIRSLNESTPAPELPLGFQIRPLKGASEISKVVALHQAAFETKLMSNERRLAWMSRKEYEPQLDIVVTDPTGSLAAYCYCSFSRAENALTRRKVGYTDPIAVHPDFQRRGLARAVAHWVWAVKSSKSPRGPVEYQPFKSGDAESGRVSQIH